MNQSPVYGMSANLPPQPLCSMTFLSVGTPAPVTTVQPGDKPKIHRPGDIIHFLPVSNGRYNATLYLIPNYLHPFYNQDEKQSDPTIYNTLNDFFLLTESNAIGVRKAFGLRPSDPILCISGSSNYIGLGLMFDDFENRMLRFSKAMQKLVQITTDAFNKAKVS